MNKLGTLRNILDGELELMRTWRNEPAVRANMYTRHVITREEHLNWWEKIKKCKDNQYFIYEQADEPIGIVAFYNIDKENQNSTWAFYASPFAPKGSGSKMEYLALEYAFRELKLHKLYCEVLAYNSAVIKLHQKFAFKVEGIFRDQHKINNDFVDIYRLGIISKEWQKVRQIMLDKLMRKLGNGYKTED
jgi:UDP-4-amino-4,6-dideoxy-N-acetyl-beta-L-altrosamine N-acetyltransferase